MFFAFDTPMALSNRSGRPFGYGTGRCDFPRGSADALYRSVYDELYTLPDAIRVFVGHY
jgi:glyoxylase-like metal-dependent hydrolase (beta-lactamase superfamily II)